MVPIPIGILPPYLSRCVTASMAKSGSFVDIAARFNAGPNSAG
jgi:hypothetical protein